MAAHQDQEASRYAKPIIGREDLLALLGRKKRPMSLDAIAKASDHQKPWQKNALKKRLDAMVRDEQCRVDRKGQYKLRALLPLTEGVFLGLEEGIGRVRVGSQRVYALPAHQCITLMQGDRIQIRPLKRKRMDQVFGAFVTVIERAYSHLVGVLDRVDGHWLVTVQGRMALQIEVGHDDRHQIGMYVKVAIEAYPTVTKRAVGRVVEHLANDHLLNLRVEMTLSQHAIPHTWPEGLLETLEDLEEPSKLPLASDREDLRALPFVTIDGQSAKDFDDAVYAEKLPNGGMRVWVAIADVAHYVEEGGALDKEAKNRGNSIYFPNHVVPMLPDRLSNDLCSLCPNVDRYVVVAQMDLDAKGRSCNQRFYRAIIHSFARLTYEQVQAMIDQDAPILSGWEQAFEALLAAHHLLEAKRKARGCLHFVLEDPEIRFDAKGNVSSIAPIKTLTSHTLIENMMLLANESVAYFLHKKKASDALYRTHMGPSEEKWEQAYPFLRQLGLQVPKNVQRINPHQYQAWLQGSQTYAQQDIVHRTLLRTMQQAVYTPEVGEHFGLAYDTYTHFTSPIRRYPDLLVHRSLLRTLGLMPKQKTDRGELQDMAQHCSMTERRAEMAEREVKKALICLFMQDKVGEVFESTVRSVTTFGLFVQIDDLGVEGLIHITRLPNDYYVFDENTYRLQGRSSGRVFALNDRLTVKLDRIDVDLGRIDFYLANG